MEASPVGTELVLFELVLIFLSHARPLVSSDCACPVRLLHVVVSHPADRPRHLPQATRDGGDESETRRFDGTQRRRKELSRGWLGADDFRVSLVDRPSSAEN